VSVSRYLFGNFSTGESVLARRERRKEGKSKKLRKEMNKDFTGRARK
jgi:hypothetical protein